MSHESYHSRYLKQMGSMLEDKGIYLSRKHLDKYFASYTRGDMRPHFEVPAIPITVVIRKWSVSIFETHHRGKGNTYIRRTYFCAKGYPDHCQSRGLLQCEFCTWYEGLKDETNWHLHRR